MFLRNVDTYLADYKTSFYKSPYMTLGSLRHALYSAIIPRYSLRRRCKTQQASEINVSLNTYTK